MASTNLSKVELDQRLDAHRDEHPDHVIVKRTSFTNVHVTVTCKGDNAGPCRFFAHGRTR